MGEIRKEIQRNVLHRPMILPATTYHPGLGWVEGRETGTAAGMADCIGLIIGGTAWLDG